MYKFMNYLTALILANQINLSPLTEEIDFFTTALIIFLCIFIGLSYALYKLYRASHPNQKSDEEREKHKEFE